MAETLTQETNKILRALLNKFNIDIGDVNINLSDLENLLKGIGGAVETPGVLVVTDAVGLTAGFFAVSIANTGTVDATVLGATLKPGIVWDYCAKTGNTLGAFTYDATPVGAELTILTTKIV
jgi:hypothetical protein